MSSIDLRIGEIIQGKFEPVQINILLAFQVNCPGCFAHTGQPYWMKLPRDPKEMEYLFINLPFAS
jgi:hypothetical protein